MCTISMKGGHILFSDKKERKTKRSSRPQLDRDSWGELNEFCCDASLIFYKDPPNPHDEIEKIYENCYQFF